MVVLIDSDPDVVLKLDDTIANEDEAAVSTEAVNSRSVNLTLLDPDCCAKLADALVNMLEVDSKFVALVEIELENGV